MPISELLPQRLGNFLGIVEQQVVTRGANGFRQCFYWSDAQRCDGETFDTDLWFCWRSGFRSDYDCVASYGAEGPGWGGLAAEDMLFYIEQALAL